MLRNAAMFSDHRSVREIAGMLRLTKSKSSSSLQHVEIPESSERQRRWHQVRAGCLQCLELLPHGSFGFQILQNCVVDEHLGGVAGTDGGAKRTVIVLLHEMMFCCGLTAISELVKSALYSSFGRVAAALRDLQALRKAPVADRFRQFCARTCDADAWLLTRNCHDADITVPSKAHDIRQANSLSNTVCRLVGHASNLHSKAEVFESAD
eukprot:6196238-Pleurochrysis_carterae.AAC.1